MIEVVSESEEESPRLKKQKRPRAATSSKYEASKRKFIENDITTYALQAERDNNERAIELGARLSPFVEELMRRLNSTGLETLRVWLTNYNLYGSVLKASINVLTSSGASCSLQPFQASDVSGSEDIDKALNACGPIWSIAFAPSPERPRKTKKPNYFVVGTSRLGWPEEGEEANGLPTLKGEVGVGNDTRHILGSTHSRPNLLQVWEAGASVKDMPSMVLGIGFASSGAHWSLAWSPAIFPNTSSTLGVLAVLCGDGSVRVLCIPKNEAIKSASWEGMPVCNGEDCTFARIGEGKESSDSFYGSPLTAFSWDPSSGSRLCCGHADGTVTVWDLDYELLLGKIYKSL